MSKTEERVWAYMVAHRKATPAEVAEACDVDPAFVRNLIARIGTPEEIWRGADDAPLKKNPKSVAARKKPKLSSAPVCAIREMGEAMEEGAAKYGRFDYRNYPISAAEYYDAAQRHLMDWMDGLDADPDSGLSPLAHVMACMAILIDTKRYGNLVDDRKGDPK